MATIIEVIKPHVDNIANFSSKHGHVHLGFMMFRDICCNFIHEKMKFIQILFFYFTPIWTYHLQKIGFVNTILIPKAT